jgi:hypothetical protein
MPATRDAYQPSRTISASFSWHPGAPNTCLPGKHPSCTGRERFYFCFQRQEMNLSALVFLNRVIKSIQQVVIIILFLRCMQLKRGCLPFLDRRSYRIGHIRQASGSIDAPGAHATAWFHLAFNKDLVKLRDRYLFVCSAAGTWGTYTYDIARAATRNET